MRGRGSSLYDSALIQRRLACALDDIEALSYMLNSKRFAKDVFSHRADEFCGILRSVIETSEECLSLWETREK